MTKNLPKNRGWGRSSQRTKSAIWVLQDLSQGDGSILRRVITFQEIWLQCMNLANLVTKKSGSSISQNQFSPQTHWLGSFPLWSLVQGRCWSLYERPLGGRCISPFENAGRCKMHSLRNIDIRKGNIFQFWVIYFRGYCADTRYCPFGNINSSRVGATHTLFPLQMFDDTRRCFPDLR